MLTNLSKFPAPYFGGKTHAAPHVWTALGDVDHYVEPFCGTCATLLLRPHPCNRAYHSETVNDSDGLLVNALRSLRLAPDATAEAASNYVAEADLHAMHLALVAWRKERQLEHLMGDLDWHDPVMGGRWLFGLSCWIGSGWCDGTGGWVVGADGRIEKRSGNHGGVNKQLPSIGNNGRGAIHAGTREPGTEDAAREYHPMTMPELTRWFRFLSARLRHVRILNGDWKRAVTSAASKTLPVRMGGHCGVFLDPPYADTASRASGLYAHDSESVAHEAREWALEHGDDPRYRIVLAGYEGEHQMSPTWREVEWFRDGFLTGGMKNIVGGGGTHQQARERLWISKWCTSSDVQQVNLFGVVAP